MNHLHTEENGKVSLRSLWATFRCYVAEAFPFWDGDAPGRAYSNLERRVLSLRKS